MKLFLSNVLNLLLHTDILHLRGLFLFNIVLGFFLNKDFSWFWGNSFKRKL